MTDVCDVVVIGGGGAGLTAAMYTARSELTTILFEKKVCGGQIAITDLVENYPGFPEGVLGADIAFKMEEQAKKNGVTIIYDDVSAIEKMSDGFQITSSEGIKKTKTAILAMGAHARKLDVPGESTYIGKGVSYCATCDAPFFRNKIVAVIGGGNAALQEAIFLTKFARKVYIVHRRDELRAGVILQERVKKNEKIDIVWNSVVAEVKGNQMVSGLQLRNVITNELSELTLDGMFVFIGHDPSSELVKDIVERDESGYIKTDEAFMTSIEGMYACGEVRHGAAWQLVASCGEGCKAALSAEKYLDAVESW